jgi:GT2 family glycosyltransferase
MSNESRLFIVDNATSEESFSYLKTHAPEAEIIRNKRNDGFAKGNNDAIKRALRENYDYIILFNMDVVVDKNCVTELVHAAQTDKKIGAVQARLMLWPEKEKINSLGNVTHFLGFGYSHGYRQKFDGNNAITNIAYPSGAAVLFTAAALRKAGLFDEEFWMYNEDQDIGWRLWLSSYRCVMAPRAVVWHKYEFSKSIKKYYWMDRNRIIVILKNYHWLTLILIAPAFVVMELGLILFSLKTGWFGEKMRVWRYFLTPRTWTYLLEARRQTQRLRISPDREIVKLFSGRIWYQEIDDAKLRIVNPVFDLYWRVIKRVI